MTLHSVVLFTHIMVNAAIHWFETILQAKPGFQNDLLATLSFDAITVIIAASFIDAHATLGIEATTATSARSSSAARFRLNRRPTRNGVSGRRALKPRHPQM